MGVKLTRIMNRYAQPGMWAAGICTAAGIVCQHFSPIPWMAAVLFVLGAFLAGLPVLVRAIQGLRFKTVGIECLVSIAVIGAFSLFHVFHPMHCHEFE